MSNIEGIYTADLFLGYIPVEDQIKERDRYVAAYENSSPSERRTPIFQVTCRIGSPSEFDEIWSDFNRSPFQAHVETCTYGEFVVIELDCDKKRQSIRSHDLAIALKSSEFDAVLASEGRSLAAWNAFHESIKPMLLPME
ncbi:MAG: hypothetical protein RLO18_00085 [Gimesia chilikensis]